MEDQIAGAVQATACAARDTSQRITGGVPFLSLECFEGRRCQCAHSDAMPSDVLLLTPSGEDALNGGRRRHHEDAEVPWAGAHLPQLVRGELRFRVRHIHIVDIAVLGVMLQ